MAKYFRYALAALFLAASVACLALWWRSMSYLDRCQGPIVASWILDLTSYHGIAEVGFGRDYTGQIATVGWMRPPPTTERPEFDLLDQKNKGVFGYSEEYETLFFPIWFASLIFALAGVGVLCLRRQFSIRSTLIATTVVAALIGMAVIL